MKKSKLCLLFFMPLAIGSLAACDIGEVIDKITNKEEDKKTDDNDDSNKTHEHVYSELHAKVEPTCLSTGTEAYYTCEGCDKLFNEDKEEISQIQVLPALSHVPHEHEEVPASCTEPGTGKYWTCDCEGDENLYGDAQCKNVIQSIPVVPAKGHHPEKVNGQAATCLADGYEDYYECDCGALFEDAAGTKPIANLAAWKAGDGKIEKVAHSYGTPSVEWNGKSATATATCENCPDEISETKDGSFVEDTAATCHSAQTGHYEVTFNDTRLGSARTEANSVTGDPATGLHTYGTPSVQWNGVSATATATCADCPDQISETKDGSFVEDTPVTCHSAQTGHYEVTFDDTRLGSARTEANTATGAAATGEHTYGTAEVSWNGSSATATATCTAEGCDAYITETKEGTFAEDTAVTCTAPQKGHYEVTFDDSRLGSASTTANSVEVGDPHAHSFGVLTPRVEAVRENDGNIAYYQCSECNGYFNEEHESISAESIVIPAPAQHFDAAGNLTISLNPIATTETIYVDIKFVGAQTDSKINISLLGTKDGGGNDWDNYLGYFELYEKSVATNAGISAATITDDGWFRIKIDMNAITKVSGVKPASVNALYVRGAWSNVEGYIEVNSAVSAHTKASELIPAKAAGPHGDDGYQAHYECTGCNDYWFNESGALCKKEDLIIKSNVVKYAPPASGNTLAEFKNLGNITDKVSVDIHFDNPTVHQEVGFNFYESAWDNYYGTFWVDCDDSGVYFEGDYAGITLDELTDGWWRVTAYPSALNMFKKDKADIDQKHSIDFIYIKGPNTVSNRGSGMFELNSAFEGTVPSTKVYSLSGKNSFTTTRTFLPGSIINLDINFKNNTQAQIDLMTGWDPVCRFKVNPNGTIVDQKEGIQVFKLNNELVGYPTLEGTWYRIVINTNNITPMKVGYPSIMRIGGNNWNEAEFDMMINSPYTTDGWYTFAGGSSNTQINVKSPNIGVIRDSSGDLVNGKAFQFKVKGEGTGNVKFSLMEHNSWKNCNNMNLIFANSVLTEAVCSGSPNKWAKVDDLGNGVYSVTVPFEKMLADGFGEAKTIGFFYGDGVIANGLTSFSINLLDIGLVDYVA